VFAGRPPAVMKIKPFWLNRHTSFIPRSLVVKKQDKKFCVVDDRYICGGLNI
jgi:hypothetical protein